LGRRRRLAVLNFVETALPLEHAALEMALRRGKPGKADQDSSEHANDKQSHAIPLPGDGVAFLLRCHFALVAYLSRKSVKRSLSPPPVAAAHRPLEVLHFVAWRR